MQANDSDVKKSAKKRRTSIRNKSNKEVIKVKRGVIAVSSDEEKLNVISLAVDSAVNDMSKALMDTVKPAVTETIDVITDDEEASAVEDSVSVSDEDKDMMLFVTDVWKPEETAEASENCEATELEEINFDKENPASQDAMEVSKKKDKLVLLLSESAKGIHGFTDDNASFTALSKGVERKLSSSQKVEAFQDDDDDDVIFLRVTSKDDDIETSVREDVIHLVDQVSETLQSAVDRVARDCKATPESVSLSSGSFTTVGSDDRGTASFNSAQVHASVAEKKETASENSNLSADDKKDISRDDRVDQLVKIGHKSLVQDREKSCVESEMCATSECVVHEETDENVKHSDESACLSMEDEIATSISDFLIGTSVLENVGDLSKLYNVNGENDTVSDNTNLLSSDVVLKQQEPSAIRLLQQEGDLSLQTSDVGRTSSNQDATEKVVDSECLMPLAEDLQPLSNASTLSYESSDVMKESSNVQDERSALSMEPETESVEHWSCLSSGDQHDVPPANDCGQVSESMEQDHGDADEGNLLPASEDVDSAVNDDEDFEIDLL